LAGSVMAEGSETPNGEQGGPEGRPRRGEADFLAERRARRAAESGELALVRRAEAAEATVHTLERHVSSLQQRLREVEEERLRTDELLDAERAATREREHELQRAKQREYAEQQLRLEAEDRVAQLTAVSSRVDRESREEIERLDARLSASEDDAHELARQLQAAAEQVAAARRASASAESALQARLGELERRAGEIQRGLEDERAARERSEALLQSMRDGHRQMELLLGEIKDIVARVTGALSAPQRAYARPAPPATPEAERPPSRPSETAHADVEHSALCQRPAASDALDAKGAEMADALAVAVERLRARAQDAAAPEDAAPEDTPPVGTADTASEPSPTPPSVPAHRHSMSLIGRLRMKRKQRRGR
jgi:hypothetical protein